MEEFKLDGRQFIALCDLLKMKGFCPTGGQAKQAVSEGLVKVDGAVETQKRAKIQAGQVVEFEGQVVKVL